LHGKDLLWQSLFRSGPFRQGMLQRVLFRQCMLQRVLFRQCMLRKILVRQRLLRKVMLGQCMLRRGPFWQRILRRGLPKDQKKTQSYCQPYWYITSGVTPTGAFTFFVQLSVYVSNLLALS
jgi:hypothetical protein